MRSPGHRNVTVPPNATTTWTDDPDTWGTSCLRGEDFDIDVGTFMVVGPSPITQQMTCVSGWTCALEVTGTGIRDVDRVMILETCGVASLVEGLPHSLGTEVVHASGGTYQLCWCATSGLFSCSLSVEFTFGFGQMHILGPLRGQDRTCVAGQTCAVDILGLGISDEDRFWVLETCGAFAALPRFPASGLSAPLSDANSSTGSTYFAITSTAISWGLTAVTAQGGDFRLCWCSSTASRISNRSCSFHPSYYLVNTTTNRSGAVESLASANNGFLFDAGRLRIRGVFPLEQDRTCISGQICQIDGITGMDLKSGDAVMALETCGVNHAISRFAWAGRASNVAASGSTFSWGPEPVTAAGGVYRLCWCAASSHSCGIPSSYAVDFGSLTLLGSKAELISHSRTCVSGTICRLHQLESQQLTPSSQFLILDSCGVASQVSRLPITASRDSNGTFSSLEFRIATAAGQYRLCWCEQECTDALQFSFDAGSFMLLGPSPLDQHRTCVSGQPCAIEGLTGIGLQDLQGGSFSVLETCSTPPWNPTFPPVPGSQCLDGGSVLWLFNKVLNDFSAAKLSACTFSKLEYRESELCTAVLARWHILADLQSICMCLF